MKAGDLKPCALCGRGVMNAGIPLFYRVSIEHMGVDLRAVQRTSGMETFFGGAVALARVFEDSDIAKPIDQPSTRLVCQSCSLEPHMLARLADPEPATERAREAAELARRIGGGDQAADWGGE